MTTGYTPRRVVCPQCQGSGVWGTQVTRTLHVCHDCDICGGAGMTTPHRAHKYRAREQAQGQQQASAKQ